MAANVKWLVTLTSLKQTAPDIVKTKLRRVDFPIRAEIRFIQSRPVIQILNMNRPEQYPCNLFTYYKKS